MTNTVELAALGGAQQQPVVLKVRLPVFLTERLQRPPELTREQSNLSELKEYTMANMT